MTDDLSGDIVIEKDCVRFSDKVGKYVTGEQTAVLYRTAERLGKFAVDDRYPTNAVLASCIETCYGSSVKRNKYGVPEEHLFSMLKIQAEDMRKS